jgi:thioredoxin reductase (NADPH)
MNPDPARELTGASPALASGTAVPQLSADQFDRMTAYGVAQPVELGDIVVRPGDVDYDLILVESGWIEILSPAIGDEPESVVARYGSGGFLGELNFLTGQTAYLMARASEAGRIHRISRGRFRRLMATEPDLSDILLRTFLARRDLLRDGHLEDASNTTQEEQVTGTAKIHSTTTISSILKNKNKKD